MLLDFFKMIEKYQSPDEISVTKQWRQRRFHWYWIKCTWYWHENLVIQWDLTHHLMRTLWSADKIPIYTKWKHIIRDDDFINKKEHGKESKKHRGKDKSEDTWELKGVIQSWLRLMMG